MMLRRYHPSEVDETPSAQRPARSAKKDVWVAWAVAQGADESEAAGLSKGELVAQFGGDGD